MINILKSSICQLLHLVAFLLKWLGVLFLIWAAYWGASHYYNRSQMQTSQGVIVGFDTRYIKSHTSNFANYYRTVGQNEQLMIEFTDDAGKLQKFTSARCLAEDDRQVGNTLTVYYEGSHREVNCVRAWFAPIVLLIIGSLLLVIGFVLLRLIRRQR